MVTLQLGMVMRVWSGRRLTGTATGARICAIGIRPAGSFALLAAATAGHVHVPLAAIVAILVFAGICVSAWHGVAYTARGSRARIRRHRTRDGQYHRLPRLFATPLAIPPLLAVSSWSVVARGRWSLARPIRCSPRNSNRTSHAGVAAHATTPAQSNPSGRLARQRTPRRRPLGLALRVGSPAACRVMSADRDAPAIQHEQERIDDRMRARLGHAAVGERFDRLVRGFDRAPPVPRPRHAGPDRR